MNRFEQRGFTLMELLAVVVIVVVLSGLAFPVMRKARMRADCAACLSNQRQIGAGLLLYAGDNDGELPPTTHSTGRRRIDESWVYELRDYLGNFDRVRVCPAESAARRKKILERKATSYVLNDQVFDEGGHNSLPRIPHPARTMILFILSENRSPSETWDHAHCGEWKGWHNVLNDLEVDRHRVGKRSADRLKGSSNYLFADGHVETIPAAELKKRIDAGLNPGDVPLE